MFLNSPIKCRQNFLIIRWLLLYFPVFVYSVSYFPWFYRHLGDGASLHLDETLVGNPSLKMELHHPSIPATNSATTPYTPQNQWLVAAYNW